jgi:hypothetical protein
MADDALGWVRTVAMVAHEHLRSFSSWFTPEQSLKFWEQLTSDALMGTEARRMVELIRRRLLGNS